MTKRGVKLKDLLSVAGPKLKKLRLDAGLTQQELASHAKITDSRVRSIESSAIANVAPEAAQGMAARLGVKLEEILDTPAISAANSKQGDPVPLAHPAIRANDSDLTAKIREVLQRDGTFNELPERLRESLEQEELDEDEKERLADYLIVQLHVYLALIRVEKNKRRDDAQ